MRCGGLKSWLFEGSLDGENWTEIHQETDNTHFVEITDRWHLASFAVSQAVECRFIRLTQIDAHSGTRCFNLEDVEFFGTLYE
jgi:hypothetical protein